MKIKIDKKEILSKFIISAAYLIIILLFYHFKVGCIFQTFLGIPCPGCGMTRAFFSLIRFNFIDAFKFHPMIYAMPLLYIYFWTNGKLFGKTADKIIVSVILTGFAIHWIINLVNFIS